MTLISAEKRGLHNEAVEGIISFVLSRQYDFTKHSTHKSPLGFLRCGVVIIPAKAGFFLPKADQPVAEVL